jgi:regulator of RNase E activity RraA
VRKSVTSPGNGRVLVVDGGGSTRCALLGDMLAAAAVENGWAVRVGDQGRGPGGGTAGTP